MPIDCTKFNSYLFRRTPNWDKELARDRYPHSFIYTSFYEQKMWPSFTGTEHRWDRVHVSMPNDDECWEQMDAGACITDICDPAAKYIGWGSTRSNYYKYHQDYKTPVFCFDQLRHVEMAKEQLAAIVDGLKELPEPIMSGFLRFLALRQSDYIHIAGAAGAKVAVTADMFTNGCSRINIGVANLPTSKLTMAYLNRQIPTLLYNGYFKKDFLPDGTFTVTSDLQTIQDLSKENPTLYQRWKPENFMRGGSFYKYGMIDGIGNWVFKLDPEPMRFQDLGGGIIGRVRAYQNEAATEGKKPVYDTNYDLARYQFYHVWARAAREVHVGDLSPVNSDMSFKVSRNLMGKWSWQNPDYFKATDPCSGEVCEYENYKKNKGFFLGEFEAGLKTIYPEIEMWILAQREPQQVIDVPACSDESEVYYQTDLYPYNCDYCTE